MQKIPEYRKIKSVYLEFADLMSGNGAGIDIALLKELYRRNPTARLMLEDFARRGRNRAQTTVDSLVFRLTMENPRVNRSDILGVFHELEKIGCGNFIVGRKGHPSRFQWAVGLSSVGKTAIGEEVALEPVSEEERGRIVREAELETYVFPLRLNLKVKVDLPIDLSSAEASRLAEFIKTLPLDRNSSD